MGRGAWQATVQRAAKTQTQLSTRGTEKIQNAKRQNRLFGKTQGFQQS